MKLVRYGASGAEKPAILDGDGRLRDLSAHVADITTGDLAAISKIDIGSLPLVEGSPRLGVPWANIPKFIAIGMNYHDHVRETGMPKPEEPVIFIKATSCIAGPNDDVEIPRKSVKTDYEIELGIVIGKTARYISEDDALDHVAGYVLSNDVSEREHQIERGGSWDKGKGHDGFGPIGPWLVTQDELGDAGDIALTTRVNGEIRQDGSTADMIFGVKEIVAYTSNFFTLEPGDIIITGTPSGVGIGQKPEPKFLRNGDIVELDGGPLGVQRQRFVAHEQDMG